VALQAVEDVLRNSDGHSPVVSQLPFAKARDVSFFTYLCLLFYRICANTYVQLSLYYFHHSSLV